MQSFTPGRVSSCLSSTAATVDSTTFGRTADANSAPLRGGVTHFQAATAVARLENIKRDTIIEPRVLGGFQIPFDRIDHRIADIVEEGLQRKAFAQRVALPRLAAGTGRATQPVRERFRPITKTEDLAVVHTVREQLRPTTGPRVNGPGASRAELHAALIHRPAGRRQPGAAPSL